jgi:hypothetical protein
MVVFAPIANVSAINRYVQSSNVQASFVWNAAFHLPKGDLSSQLQFPLAMAASGLPNKVMPNEAFSIPFSLAVVSGVKLSVGNYQFDLDPIIQMVIARVPEEIDLTPYVADFTCAVAYVTLDPASSAIACSVVKQVVRYIALSLVNRLIVTGQTTGPATLQSTSMQTWLGRSNSFTINVDSQARRGQQMGLTLLSAWTVGLHFDFQQSLYNDPIIGPIFARIRDALHLPWEPSLGVAHSNANPNMNGIVLIPDFQLTTSNQELNIVKGQSASVQVTASPIDEFDSPIDLTVSASTGVKASLSTAQITPSSSATMTVSASDVGDYQVLLNAVGGGKSHAASVTLHVTKPIEPGGTSGFTAGPDKTLIITIVVAILIILGTFGAIVLARNRGSTVVHKQAQASRATPVTAHQPTSNIWFCRYCGSQVPVDSAYCNRCGKSLA